jgi:hypothetical protein
VTLHCQRSSQECAWWLRSKMEIVRYCSLLSCLDSRLPGSCLYWKTRAKS